MERLDASVRMAELLAGWVTEQITADEKEELGWLLKSSGIANEKDVAKIIRREVLRMPDSSESEVCERILGVLTEKIGQEQRHKTRSSRTTLQPLWRRMSRYAALFILLIGLASVLYVAMRPALPQEEGVIWALSGEVTLEYPSGVHVAIADTVDLSAIIQHEEKETPTQAAPVEEVRLYKIKVPRGISHTATLEDGTIVHLFPESELRFPSPFGRLGRSVELTGEGYFEVAHDALRPFTVAAGGASITVMGTSFNIRAYEHEATVSTVLVSGKVSVNETELLPNQMAVFDCTNQDISVVDTNGKVYWERAQGMWVFENVTLDQIMHDLSLWFDFEYRCTDEALQHKMFRFKLSRTEEFSRITNLMRLTGEVDFKISDRQVEVMPVDK